MVAAIGRNRVAQQGGIELSVVGDSELQAAIQEITSGMVDKIAPAGIRGYLRVASKAIKAEIPSQYKEARKGIGWRFRKKDKWRKGRVTAKVGNRVGVTRAKQKQSGEKTKQGRRPGRGVGLSAANLHWAMKGTQQRTRKKSGNGPTGKMPPLFPHILASGMRKSRGEALSKFRELSRAAMVREAQKIRAKARKQVNAKANRLAKRGVRMAVRRAL